MRIIRRRSAVFVSVTSFFLLVSASASALEPYQKYLPRPVPLGVEGSNAAYNVAPDGVCRDEQGTLGGLVADQNGIQYILGAAHILALGPSGYFASGSAEAIVQPGLPEAGIGCPPSQSGISSDTVAAISTVVPINLSSSAVNQADAVLAQITPGAVQASQYGIPTYSGTVAPVVTKKMKVMKFGASSGLTQGKIASKVAETVKYKICSHISTKNSDVSCDPVIVKFANVILTTPGLGVPGDSGALVLTSDQCPQPVGLYVGDNGKNGFVTDMPAVLNALQSVGSYTQLSIVPGASGCSAPAAQVAAYDTPDADAALALNAQGDLETLVASLNIVDGVGIDLSGSVATLDVIAEDGYAEFYGANVSDATVVEEILEATLGNPMYFEGVPVEVSTIQTVDLSQGSSWGN